MSLRQSMKTIRFRFSGSGYEVLMGLEYDERMYDASIPDTATEELLGCIHILYKMSGHIDKVQAYKFVDKFLLSPCDDFDGIIPMQLIMDGEGMVVLEFLRDVELRQIGPN